VVARPRQRQEFLETLEASRSAVQENQQKLEKLENTLQQSRETTQKLEKELKNSTSRVNQLAQEVQQANLTLEKARHQLEWQKNQIQDVERQIQKSEADLQATQKQANLAGAEIQKANDQVREHVRSLNALPMEDYQTQLTHWNTGVAVTGRALTETNARMKDLAQALETNLAQQRALRERINANENALVQAENEKASLLEQQTTLNGEIEQFRERIEPAESELSGLEQEYSRVQVNLTTAQQALAVAERYSSQAQMDLTRQREGLDSLRRRIEDDFGLVSFEYSDQVEGQTTLPLEGMVEQLPRLLELPADLEENINRQRAHLRRMGPISPEALNEYREVKERRDFMVSQVEDLKKADVDLRQVIAELDELMKREFRKTFTAVAAEFRQMFTRLFNGGSATLELVDEDNLAEAGIEIEARLPGRREQGLSLLSGGERSLTAAALIFSLLKVSPTPFCVLDEVDAMLDEANVGRYRDLLKELSVKTQFIVITHNRNTVQVADVIYGVTMGRDSASQVISLRLDEIGDEMVR
jgi:chromosome segregation protein